MGRQHVESAVYIDDNGDEVAPSAVDTYYRMQRLGLVFSCPICSSTNDAGFSYPLNDTERYTCTTCGNQYYMVPHLEARDGSDSTISRIEYQLDCVEEFHEVVIRLSGRHRMRRSNGSLAVISIGIRSRTRETPILRRAAKVYIPPSRNPW